MCVVLGGEWRKEAIKKKDRAKRSHVLYNPV
jgi:hypothetical protein